MRLFGQIDHLLLIGPETAHGFDDSASQGDGVDEPEAKTSLKPESRVKI